MAETPDQDMALRLAKARQWIAHQGNRYLPTWDDLPPIEQEQAETEARYWIQAAVNAGVTIVPAGRSVIDLPEPDGHDEIAGIWWWDTFKGRVESRTGTYDEAREADYRAMAVAMLAAAEHNKLLRLAAEQHAVLDNNQPTT